MRSNIPLTLEQIEEACPAVFQEAAHPEKVSDKYQHISTLPVLAAMSEAGFGVSRAQQTKTRAAGARGYARHLLSFRPMSAFAKTTVGDAIPEVVLINSHDGNSAYRLHVGLFRMVCENGMIAGRNFETISIRHRGSPALEVAEQSQRIFEEYVPKLKDWVAGATTTILTQKQMNQFAEQAQQIRYEEQPFDPRELLAVRRGADEGNDLWHVYNRVQENLMRGGIKFMNANNRSCETKPINRVTKDVIFNQKLWDVANDYLPRAA